jgi:hypothetical protein
MKRLHWILFIALGLVLAACSTEPFTPVEEEASSTEATLVEDGKILRPAMQSIIGESVLETQAETYFIQPRFVGNPPNAVRQAISTARNRWQGIITRGKPAINLTVPANSCGSNPRFSGMVDDLLVFTGVSDIDGPGNVLAQSGPCFIRTNGSFPVVAVLIFDAADVGSFSQSELTLIATHELGHSVGIGTIWDLKGVLVGAGGSNPRFTGANAVREYNRLGGSGSVPVESTGGPGTRDSHWRETTFDNELMTGFLNGGRNPLSRLTVASLRDLGYAVDLTKADSYQLP